MCLLIDKDTTKGKKGKRSFVPYPLTIKTKIEMAL